MDTLKAAQSETAPEIRLPALPQDPFECEAVIMQRASFLERETAK